MKPLPTLGEPPLLSRLRDARTVLLAGAGGGFDVFCALPLFFWLRAAGKTVHLANVTFSKLGYTEGRRVAEAALEVDADSDGPVAYFPEKYLCEWFRARGDERSIQCLEPSGVAPATEAWRALTRELGADTVVLVDGGTDILMRGDEAGLGTPVEDIASLAAVHSLELDRKLLVCLGFGVDRYHGVCHAHFLENVAALQRDGAWLGGFSLLPEMPEVAPYLDAVAYVSARMPRHPSIVSGSIVAALGGAYGDVHASDRTEGSALWINPLLTFYWGFELDAVARRNLYLDKVRDTRSALELKLAIDAFRRTAERRPWEDIPV